MKKIIKTLASALMLLTIIISLSACSDDSDKLKVAMELAYPPFEGKNDAGEPYGVSIDIANEIGKRIDMEVEIVNTAWTGLIPSLTTGKADMVISSMTITDERKETVDFTNPYANSLLAILANKKSNIETVDDLNKAGKKIAVKTGSTGYIFATNNLPNAEIIALEDESACVLEVSQGKADAFLYDQLTIYRNQQAYQDSTEAIFIPFQDTEFWGIALKKGDSELLAKINTCLKEMQEDGTFDKISEKHLAEEKTAFEELGFKWFFDIN